MLNMTQRAFWKPMRRSSLTLSHLRYYIASARRQSQGDATRAQICEMLDTEKPTGIRGKCMTSCTFCVHITAQ